MQDFSKLKLKKFNLFVGKPEAIEHAIAQTKGYAIFRNYAHDVHYTEANQWWEKLFRTEYSIATTQSYEAIRMFYNAAVECKKLRSMQLVRIDRYEDGKWCYVHYDANVMLAGISRNIEIR